jgi:hypothetical protein
MTTAPATAQAFLVIIDTQAGPQPQIWYEDHGRFVGCGHLKPAEKHPLPPAVTNDGWSIDRAVSYIAGKHANAA